MLENRLLEQVIVEQTGVATRNRAKRAGRHGPVTDVTAGVVVWPITTDHR
ncbi:hypothetical protein [Actinophytocola sp.]